MAALPTNRQSGQVISAADINAIAAAINTLFGSTDFREAVEQVVGTLVTTAGGTFTSNGAGVGTITFPAGSVDQQSVKNTVGQMVAAAGGTYDGASTITFPSGSAGTPSTGSVGTAQLADGAVTSAKVTSLSADKLVDGSTNRVYSTSEKNKVANAPADTNSALAAKVDVAALTAAVQSLTSAIQAATVRKFTTMPSVATLAGLGNDFLFTVDA